MQRQRSSMGSLPDFISFDLNPTATDAASLPDFISFDLNPTATDTSIEQPVFWNNNIQTHTQTTPPGVYLTPANHTQNLSNWNMGESSSSATQNYFHDETSAIPYSPLFVQNRNMSVEVGENSGNNRHVIEENMQPPPSNGGYFGEEIYSSEGCRLSCKRKATEGHIGQSSSSGNSSYFQPRENPFYACPQGQSNARIGLGGGSGNYENTLPLNLGPNLESFRSSSSRVRINLGSGNYENTLPINLGRNLESSRSSSSRVRINSSSPQLIISNNSNSNSNISPMNNFQGTRTPQLSRGSSSRVGHPSSLSERISIPNEVPEIPIIQVPRHSGGTPPRYSQRLSEYLHRLSESGGQSSNLAQQQGSSSSQQGAASGSSVDRLSRLRSALLLERQLDGALEGASSSRRAASRPEGRQQIVSEIRNVLDLMRRGGGLRLEDVVFLDQSIFFGMADIHDRHRDMRLDVDNMSYEELLALEERMGNVSTGLSEETILKGLKQRKFFTIAMGTQSEVEPCCICREEYDDGEDIGTVECGHEFHSGCIKQWLMIKNSCPICKTTALNK